MGMDEEALLAARQKEEFAQKHITRSELAKQMRLSCTSLRKIERLDGFPSGYRVGNERGSLCFDRVAVNETLDRALAAYNAAQASGAEPFAVTTVSWLDVFLGAQYSGPINLEIVVASVKEICGIQGFVTREDVVAATGLTYHKVDERLGGMFEAGLLRRPRPGVYTLVERMPQPRAVSVTNLPGGPTKVEVGDDLMTLWPQERRELARLLMGDAVQFTHMQSERDFNLVASELHNALKLLRRIGVMGELSAKAEQALNLSPLAQECLDRFARNGVES